MTRNRKRHYCKLSGFPLDFFSKLQCCCSTTFRAGILCMIKGEVRNPNVFSHIEVSYLARASLEGILEGMPPAFFADSFEINLFVDTIFCFNVVHSSLKRQKRSHWGLYNMRLFLCSIIHILQPFFCHIIMIYTEERYICLLKY